MECEICKKKADGIYHILPTDFIESVNFHVVNKDEEIVSLNGDNNSNCIYLCEECKRKFLNKPVVPFGRLQKEFLLLSRETRYAYSCYLLAYRNPIINFLMEVGIQYSEEHRMFLTNMQYALLCKEFLDFYRLFEERKEV